MLDNKEKSWFRKSDAYITAFLVPVIVLLIIYAQRGIYPFGDSSYLKMDMYHQYAPFLSEFRNKLVNGRSLFYSWNIGMGVNFIPVISYYLASPFNWLIAFVPRQHILEFMDYGIVLKTGLAGLTMAVFLHRHSENSNFAPSFFGIFYALSGYMAAYSWNVMWLDCIVLFPLICLGIEKIVYEKRGLLYALTLGVCIVSNYYISIMICIFAVIYFIMLLIMKGKQGFGSFAGCVGIFAGFSILAGGVAAVLWLPQLYEYAATASAENDFPKVVESYFSIVDVIARHMINVETELELDHWPNIYCGVAVVPLAVLYVANRKISVKEKCIYGLAAFFMLASFSLNILAYLWHGCHFPNSLPSRQSFIYIFLILFMGFRVADQLEGNKLRDIGIAFAVSAAFVLLFQKFEEGQIGEWSVWYLSLGFIAVYSLILYLYRSGKLNVNAATFIILAVISIEAAINMTNTGITTTGRDQYLRDNENVRAVVNHVAYDEDFYRFEKNRRLAKDDGAWMNFPSVSLFASTAHADMSDLYSKLGCEASTNAYSIVGSTPLVDALFDIKYSIYTGKSVNPYQIIVCRSGDTELYRNKYCLPLGYLLPADIDSKWILDAGNPVLVQNQLCKVFGTDDVLKQVDGFREGGIYSFTVPEDGLYYAFSDNAKTSELEVARGDETKKYEHVDRGYFIELGWLNKNEIIDLKPTDGTEVFIHAYRFNYDALADIAGKLSETGIKVTGYDDTHISAEIDIPSDKSGTLLMTIPYDEGWTVYVDGKKTPIHKTLNAFIGFDTGSGHHEISMSYCPQGLEQGMMVSAACVGILILIAIISLIVFIVRKSKAKTVPKSEEKEIDNTPVNMTDYNDEEDEDAFDGDDMDGQITVMSGDEPPEEEYGTEEQETERVMETMQVPDPQEEPDNVTGTEQGPEITEENGADPSGQEEQPETADEKETINDSLIPKGTSHARSRSRGRGR